MTWCVCVCVLSLSSVHPLCRDHPQGAWTFQTQLWGWGLFGGVLFSLHSFRFPHNSTDALFFFFKKRIRLVWKQSESDIFIPEGVILFLFIPQDLKPGNLAINPDCELKVCWSCIRYIKTWTHLNFTVFWGGVFFPSDPGFWPGEAGGCRNDRLRRDPLVSSAWGYPKLDALHTNW